MSYRISPSVLGSLTLTGCEVGSTQWQGREIEQLVCLDEPIPYDYYNNAIGNEIYYDYNCQNPDVISTSLPISGYISDDIYTHQYFLDLSNQMGTLIVQQSFSINNKSYTSSYFLQAKIESQSARIILLNFGYLQFECDMQPNILRCSWYEGVYITFDPATTDIVFFD